MNFWNENETAKTTSGFPFDKRLFKHDIMGSIAHCTMMSEQEILSEKDAKTIQKALTELFYDITSEKVSLAGVLDIFSFIDDELVNRVGVIAKKINIARTIDDRIALDGRLFIRDTAVGAKQLIKNLINAIIVVAENNLNTVMPICYHGEQGQPTTAGHTLMAFVEGLVRDIERFDAVYRRANVMPLYSAYGTGLRLPIDRKRVAELLKFDGVTQNSLDALSNNDYIYEFLLACNLTVKHVSALANSISTWIGAKGFATVDSKFTSQSPCSYTALYSEKLAELKNKANAFSSLIYKANSIDCGCIAPSRKNYEIVSTIFEAQNTLIFSVTDITEIVSTLIFNDAETLKCATSKYSTAVDCVDYLISKGADKADAYEIVGKLCAYCNENGKRLDTITLDVYNEFSELFSEDVISAMRVKNATRLRKHEGEPSDVSVRAEIRTVQRKLSKLVPNQD